jgi:hypothetical protein
VTSVASRRFQMFRCCGGRIDGLNAWCGIVAAMASFHSTYAWKRTRRIAKIQARHTCARCRAFLPGKGQLHVHHRKPVTKSLALALEPLNFEVVCPACHNSIEPRSGTPKLGCDLDGNPSSPEHPWFQK